MAGLGQGHETANQSYQADGLRDSDVLASPTLTNFNERGLMNGVVPITLNKYSDGARNTSTTLNCACSTSGNQSVTVAAGTVLIDGIFYSISAATINVATATTQYETYHTSGGNGVPPTLSANQERIVLVFVDPQVTGNIGLTYGDAIDTSSGNYPTSPSGHLARQTIVLASIRIHYSSNEVRVNKIEDKRVFIRPGPIPVSSLIDASGNAAMPATNFISGDNAGTLPITDLGFLFARDPLGLGSYADGRGGTHLFYQSDLRANQSGMGGAYQITPTHRQSVKTDTWTGGAKTITLTYSPLESQDEANTKIMEVVAYDTSPGSNTKQFLGILTQGEEYTISDNSVVINTAGANIGYNGASHVRITYTHAGHTGDVSP